MSGPNYFVEEEENEEAEEGEKDLLYLIRLAKKEITPATSKNYRAPNRRFALTSTGLDSKRQTHFKADTVEALLPAALVLFVKLLGCSQPTQKH